MKKETKVLLDELLAQLEGKEEFYELREALLNAGWKRCYRQSLQPI